jgi:4-carboxymuconolactone decarboxylase
MSVLPLIRMLPPDPPARMPPLTPQTCTAEANDMFERWRSGAFKGSDQNPVLWTFAHHPKLAELFSALNIHLLSTSTLPSPASSYLSMAAERKSS